MNVENNWQGAFVDLPKYDEFGEEYQYTLTEKDLENYRSEIEAKKPIKNMEYKYKLAMKGGAKK